MSETLPPAPAGLRLALLLVAMVRMVVPRSRRQRWQREWQGELWHRSRSGKPALLRSLNSIPHAVCLRCRSRSIDTLTQDIRYATRQMLKSPAFTTVVVLTLALGIGANTLIFSVIDSTLLRPLPFPDADRIVSLWRSHPTMDVVTNSTLRQISDWRRQVDGLEQIETLISNSYTLTEAGDPVRILGIRVSPGFFAFLRVDLAHGRGFSPGETVAGNDRVVILSHQIWQTRFAGDTAIIGRELRLDDEPFTVIGILPAHFRLPAPFATARLWMPQTDAPTTDERSAFAIARLRRGVSIEAVNEELEALSTNPEGVVPARAVWSGIALGIQLLHGDRYRTYHTALWAFQAAAALVLLIAAANVANLLLARGNARRRELAIRAAIGAGRGRLVRQLLAESLLLALVGGALGIGLAYGGTRLLVRLRPSELTALDTLRMDPRVVLVSLLVAVLTGVIFGIAPALHAVGRDLGQAIRSGARDGERGSKELGRRGLVVCEVALSTILLIGAGLLISSFLRAQQVDSGFEPDGLLAVAVHLPTARYEQADERRLFWEQLEVRLRGSLGAKIEGFAFGDGLPSRANILLGTPEIEGYAADPDDGGITNVAATVRATPNYFGLLGIPLIAGRNFNDDDVDDANNPVIINQHYAATTWPGDDPLGRRFRFGSDDSDWNTVVGVVGNVKMLGLTTDMGQRQIYYPRSASEGDWIMVRTAGDPMDMATLIRDSVWAVDPQVPMPEIALARELLDGSIAQPRFNASLMALFATVALALALVGTYSVLTYTVAQRTREIGVRMALGAPRGAVLRLVTRGGLGLILSGLLIGVAVAAVLSRFIASLLYAMEPIDPPTYLLVVGVLLVTGFVACVLPASRASRVDPMLALRAD